MITRTINCDGCNAQIDELDAGTLAGSLITKPITASNSVDFCPACTKIMLLSLEGRKSAAPANPG